VRLILALLTPEPALPKGHRLRGGVSLSKGPRRWERD